MRKEMKNFSEGNMTETDDESTDLKTKHTMTKTTGARTSKGKLTKAKTAKPNPQRGSVESVEMETSASAAEKKTKEKIPPLILDNYYQCMNNQGDGSGQFESKEGKRTPYLPQGCRIIQETPGFIRPKKQEDFTNDKRKKLF